MAHLSTIPTLQPGQAVVSGGALVTAYESGDTIVTLFDQAVRATANIVDGDSPDPQAVLAAFAPSSGSDAPARLDAAMAPYRPAGEVADDLLQRLVSRGHDVVHHYRQSGLSAGVIRRPVGA